MKIQISIFFVSFFLTTQLYAGDAVIDTKTTEIDSTEVSGIVHKEEEPKEILIADVKSKNFDISNFISYIVNVILLIAIVFLSITVFTLFRWRKKYTDKDLLKIPERHDDLLENNKKILAQLVPLINTSLEDNTKNQKRTENLFANKTEEVNSQLTTLREFTEKYNEQLKRYQDAYDMKVLKRLLLELIKLVDTFNDYIENLKSENAASDDAYKNKSLECLEMCRDVLIYRLEDYHVTKYAPNLKLKFNDPAQLECEPIKTVTTKDKNLVGSIISIIRNGYTIKSEDLLSKHNKKILRNAHVDIYIEDNEGDS